MENFEQDSFLIPIIIGFFVLFFFGNLLRRKLRDKELKRQGQIFPDNKRIPTIEERVASNRQWASGKIKSHGRMFMIILWTCAIAWNLTFGVSFIKMLSNQEAKTGGIIALGLLSLGGFVFLYFAIRATMQHFRYGESWCHISGKAGVIGKSMAGSVRTNNNIKAEGDYTIILECLETYTTGSGKNRSTKVDVIWQDKQSVPHTGKNSRVGIPFSFPLPPYPPETGYQLSRGRISWQLRISAPVQGVDYSAIFVVPVFKMD